MRHAQKFLVVLLISVLSLLTGCDKESGTPPQNIDDPVIIELLKSIDEVRIERARGNTLVAVTPDLDAALVRNLDRSKGAAMRLGRDGQDGIGLQELVRSRDDFRNLVLLNEDNDVIGLYRSALDRAVQKFLALQGKSAESLGDPATYREIFSQTFNLSEGLGVFYSFAETITERGARLFSPGTCGEVCRNIEYVITEVNENDTVWLLSPRVDLPDSDDLKLVLSGSIRGDIVRADVRGLQVLMSETFDGVFLGQDQGWVDITDGLDRYPQNGTSFRSFSANLWLDSLRGKSVVFALRVKGVSRNFTAVQMQKFAVMGKGHSSVHSYALTAPKPLELREASPRPNSGGNGSSGGNPDTPTVARPSSGLPRCQLPNSGSAMMIQSSCAIAFDKAETVTSLLGYVDRNTPIADSPFKKFSNGSPSTQGSGWKAGHPASCNGQLLPGQEMAVCVERTSRNGAADILMSPRIKFNGPTAIKVHYAYIGPTLNQGGTRRLRALVVDDYSLDVGTRLLQLADSSGRSSPFDAASMDHDVSFTGYPVVEEMPAVDVKPGVLVISAASLQDKISADGEFNLGLMLYLNNQPWPNNLSSWFVYEIAFEMEK